MCLTCVIVATAYILEQHLCPIRTRTVRGLGGNPRLKSKSRVTREIGRSGRGGSPEETAVV